MDGPLLASLRLGTLLMSFCSDPLKENDSSRVERLSCIASSWGRIRCDKFDISKDIALYVVVDIDDVVSARVPRTFLRKTTNTPLQVFSSFA